MISQEYSLRKILYIVVYFKYKKAGIFQPANSYLFNTSPIMLTILSFFSCLSNVTFIPSAFRALKNSLSDESSQVRINAIEALMDSDNPKAFETIKEVLDNDSDEEVKKNALIALYNMSDRSILDAVVNSPKYSDALKMEAVEMIDEYETESEI